MLQVNKTVRMTDIPANIIKENSDLVSDFIFSNLNGCITQSVFATALKLDDVRPIRETNSKNKTKNEVFQ